MYVYGADFGVFRLLVSKLKRHLEQSIYNASKTVFPPSTQALTCTGTLALMWLNASSSRSPGASSSFWKQLHGAEVAMLCSEAARHCVPWKAPSGSKWEGQDSFAGCPWPM